MLQIIALAITMVFVCGSDKNEPNKVKQTNRDKKPA
jgi:hypothetical protein